MSSNRSAAIVLGCLAFVVLCVVGAIAVATVVLVRGAAESTATPSPEVAATETVVPPPASVVRSPATAAAGSSRPSTPATTDGLAGLPITKSAAGELSVQIPADDVTRADPQRLFEPAKQLAQRLQPLAELRLVYRVAIWGDLRNGTMDLSGGSFIRWHFDYHHRDPTKPSGDVNVEGGIKVLAQSGRLVASADHTEMTFPGRHEVLAMPSCPVVKAWRIVVDSGAPANAVARLHFMEPLRVAGQYAWRFEIQGDTEPRREVDAMTCQLVPSAPSVPAPGPTTAPPSKPKPKPQPTATVPPRPKPKPRPTCDCAPSDLMCQFRCTGQ